MHTQFCVNIFQFQFQVVGNFVTGLYSEDILCWLTEGQLPSLSVAMVCSSVCLFIQFFLSLYGHKLPVLCLDISSVSVQTVDTVHCELWQIWWVRSLREYNQSIEYLYKHDGKQFVLVYWGFFKVTRYTDLTVYQLLHF